MAEQPLKPMLQKPPGYQHPSLPVQQRLRPPPRKPVLPPSFNLPNKRHRSCCRVCCCFLCVLVLVVIFVVAVAFGLFYLWFQPTLPVFHLQSFRIPRFQVTAKTDGTYLDAQTVVRIEVKNPNRKLSLFYKQSHVAVTFGEDKEETEVGSDDVPGFTQGKRNTKSLKVETGVRNQLVDDGEGKRLKARFRSKELVVNVEVRSEVGFHVNGLRIGPLGVKVLCGGVSLKGLEAGDTSKCIINTLKWIKIH